MTNRLPPERWIVLGVGPSSDSPTRRELGRPGWGKVCCKRAGLSARVPAEFLARIQASARAHGRNASEELMWLAEQGLNLNEELEDAAGPGQGSARDLDRGEGIEGGHERRLPPDVRRIGRRQAAERRRRAHVFRVRHEPAREGRDRLRTRMRQEEVDRRRVGTEDDDEGAFRVNERIPPRVCSQETNVRLEPVTKRDVAPTSAEKASALSGLM